jgi:hypothetical protein
MKHPQPQISYSMLDACYLGASVDYKICAKFILDVRHFKKFKSQKVCYVTLEMEKNHFIFQNVIFRERDAKIERTTSRQACLRVQTLTLDARD